MLSDLYTFSFLLTLRTVACLGGLSLSLSLDGGASDESFPHFYIIRINNCANAALAACWCSADAW